MSPDGYAAIELEYDEKGRKTRESYFGEDGKPLALMGGIASAEAVFDEDGNVVKHRGYDVNGELLVETD